LNLADDIDNRLLLQFSDMSTATLKTSNISTLANQDSTQAFIDCILLYSKNLEADAVSVEL
jgi:hypothetical protein